MDLVEHLKETQKRLDRDIFSARAEIMYQSGLSTATFVPVSLEAVVLSGWDIYRIGGTKKEGASCTLVDY